MPATYTLIASNTLSSSAASVTFSSIPGTYTDLVFRFSARHDGATTSPLTTRVTLNGTTTNYSDTRLLGESTGASSGRSTGLAYLNFNGGIVPGGATSNTFSNAEIYIPSYTVSQNKTVSYETGCENNSTLALNGAIAGLWSNTATITSIAFAIATGNFVSGSSFFLYGIKNS
jgi:hypothetical protein